METKRNKKLINLITKAVTVFFIGLFIVTSVIVMIAVLDPHNSNEAPRGNFGAKDFNEGWILEYRGQTKEVTLPAYVDAEPGDELVISNTLPENLSGGMSLMLRSSVEDMVVIIDGNVREEYSSKTLGYAGDNIPSAYIVTQLNRSDAGKKIDIHITVKNKGSLNGVRLSYGNNVWFGVIEQGLAVNIIALIVLLCGIALIVTSLFLGKSYKMTAALYLGFLVIDVAFWVICESVMRQIIFSRPSLTRYLSFLTMEMIGAFTCMYFDAVQHKIYHLRYLALEVIVTIATIVNLTLHFTGVAELFRTAWVMHVLSIACALMIIFNIISDAVMDRVKTYRISIIGGVFFIAMSLVELGCFYLAKFNVFGPWICLGLIGLMAATVIQTTSDIAGEFHAHEKQRSAMMNNTIETIAGAIDARDEYTGGHSERVGMYAGMLAREMAADYGLTEEDVLRIRYIGLVHDIGKIGVADSVLNKAGRLDDEEFSLMKRHTEIGYELMSSMGEDIEGLPEGIRHHHERFDGKGYPDGLAGDDIALSARILCLADSYDAMTSNRVYRKRLTNEEVRSEILKCSGTQFDPELAEIFVRLIDRGELEPTTVDGMSVDRFGKVTTSAMLEDRLQKDLLDNVKIMHASHIRMLCYIIKLMEKKGNDYIVVFAGPAAGDMQDSQKQDYMDNLSKVISQNLSNHDICVRYSADLMVMALFNRTQEELEDFGQKIRSGSPDLVVSIIR